MKLLYLVGLLLLGLGFTIVLIGNGFDLDTSSAQASLGLLIYVATSFIHSTYRSRRVTRDLSTTIYVAYAIGVFLVLLSIYNTVIGWQHQ